MEVRYPRRVQRPASAHNPEPLEKNLQGIMEQGDKADSIWASWSTPDVDFASHSICENGGVMFGEEYTLVSVADHVLLSRHARQHRIEPEQQIWPFSDTTVPRRTVYGPLLSAR